MFEWLGWSHYSHVALILRDPTYIQDSLYGEYMLESGEESRPCVVGGEMAWGVQLQHWPWILTSYPGEVYVRRIQWIHQPRGIDSMIAAAWDETKHARYDTNLIDLLEADLGRSLGGSVTKTDEFVCSMYAAYVLTKCGVLPDVDWGTLCPRDFEEGGRIDELLRKQCVAKLGPIEQLK